MKKRTLNAIMGACSLIACLMLCGCGSNGASVEASGGEREAHDVAIVYANRANSSADPSSAMGYIESVVENEAYLACILADGDPTMISDRFELTESNGRRRASEIEQNVRSVTELDWSAVNEEADLFAAICKANSALESTDQTDADNLLIIVDSGISTAGPIDFTDDAVRNGLIDPESFIQTLRENGDLAKFENIDEVIWVGMGRTSDPQEPVNEGTTKAMRNLYQAIFEAAGVSKISFEDGGEADPSGDVPAVTPVAMPCIALDGEGEPIGIGDKLELNETDNGRIRFITGTSDFEDPQGAIEELNQYIDQLRDFPDLHATISGYTDTTGTAQGNQVLSEERANAVKDLLVAAGVSADQVTAIGKGQSSEFGEGDVAANRRVEIEFS